MPKKKRAPTAALRISACLIVRNEETNLPRCLRSLSGKVDETIVVDTGSTDRTVEIAAEHGARVFHFSWCDDFSAARNESLRHATGDLILWVDADDELIERTPGALWQLCSDRRAAWGYFLDVHCLSTNDKAEVPVVRQWRLFPRRAGIRFEGRIHEHPAAPRVIRNNDVLDQDQVYVLHWGYAASGEVMQHKLERNRQLIERCIADEPHQPRHYFNLGTHLIAEGNDVAALPVLRQGIDRWFQAHGADTGYVPAMFSAAAGAANRLGQYAEVLDVYARTPAEFVSSELLLQSGFACQQLGRVDDALAHWQRASSDPQAVANIFTDRGAPEKARRAHATLAAERSPLVSACLIVKDEEANLPRCLASLKDAVDEIIVVDTGSTDRTLEIAASFGARTFSFPWCDDFSAARNESLRHASGRFILWQDADDELLLADPDAVRRLCRDLPDDSWGCTLDVFCPTDQWNEGQSIVRQARILRNGMGIAFHGRLHEQPAPPPESAELGLASTDALSVKHWGYVPDGDAPHRRLARNRRLLQLMLEEEPGDHLHYYNLGLQHAGEGQFPEGLPVLEQAIECWRRQPGVNHGHVPNMFAMAALCAVETGDYARALEIERGTPAEFLSADLLCHAGLAWWRLGHTAEARERFERAVGDPAMRAHNVHDRSTSSWRSLLRLSGIYDELGDAQRAYDAARQAAELVPGRPDAAFVLACAAYRLGRADEAITLARQVLAGLRDEGYKTKMRRLLLNVANDADDAALALEALSGDVENLTEPGAAYVRARAYGRLGDAQRQFDILNDACRNFPADADIRLALAELLEAQGFGPQALDVLAAGIDYAPVPPQLYQRLASLLARQGRLDDAANALELASRARDSSPTAVGEVR